jgi:UDP-glucose 4-epimerase
MNINNVLVTGAKGFVGAEIVSQLETKYGRILTVENEKIQPDDKTPNKNGRAFAVDITKRADVLRLEKIGTIDAVVHSAGLAHQFKGTSREKFQKVNVEGTANVLELAEKLQVRHFVLISSVSVYGHSPTGGGLKNEFERARGIAETSECEPEDFYAQSKLDGEKLARRFCAENNIKLTILRLATVIGEEDRGNFLHLIRQIDRRRFVWIGRGDNHKSLVHKEDVAGACLRVLEESERESEREICSVFNISADFLKMREIVKIIGSKLDRKIPPARIPAALAKSILRFGAHTLALRQIERIEKTIAKWLAEDVYSAEKIKRKLGFVPRISAREAIEREVEWYMAKN